MALTHDLDRLKDVWANEKRFWISPRRADLRSNLFRLGSHCSAFKLICSWRYLSNVQTAPYLRKNPAKNIRFCVFTLLTATEEKLSFSVVHEAVVVTNILFCAFTLSITFDENLRLCIYPLRRRSRKISVFVCVMSSVNGLAKTEI